MTLADADVSLEPNTTSVIVARPPVGTVLDVVAASGEWLQVKLPKDASGFDRVGYIRASSTKLLESAPSEPITVPRSAKPTVAVLDFEYGTVKREWSDLYAGGKGNTQPLMDVVDVGKGIADLLVDELLKVGEVRLLDRRYLDAVLREQDLAKSDRADLSASQVAQLSKVLSARYFVTGSVTKFGSEDRHVNAGALGFGPFKGLLGAVGQNKSTAHVGLSIRVLDSSSGEILGSVRAEAESKRKGLLLGGLGGGNSVAGGAIDMGSSNFQETILGEATMLAVKDAGEKLAAAIRALSSTTPPTYATQQVAQGQVNSGQQTANTTNPTSRTPVTVSPPSLEYRTSQPLSFLRLSVPRDWGEKVSDGDRGATYAPGGAFVKARNGSTAFTHGVLVGVVQRGSGNLQRDSDQLISTLTLSNKQLRTAGNYTSETIGGRAALQIALSNVSEVTGQQESLSLTTTQLAHGRVLFLICVAPQNEASAYEDAFRRVRQSVALSDR